MVETQTLGRLTPLPARSVWAHEAHDFTPWLLGNADVLGEALGMDLQLEVAEHAVGGYALDLIGQDTASGEIAIVENQLETSDHSHLGQLMTYAGGTEATTVVWIATSFREEHRAALEWLNERTDERTRFFAVEVSAVKIGDSLPAPLLTVVVKPNDWGKQVRATATGSTAMSARNGLYREFWAQFLDAVHAARPSWTNARTPPAQSWINLPTGTTDVVYGVNFSRRGLCSELYLGSPDEEMNRARFEAALAHKDQLEATYSAPLTWDPIPGKKAARIADYAPGNIEQTANWSDYVAWFIDSQTRLRVAVDAIGGIGLLLGARSATAADLRDQSP